MGFIYSFFIGSIILVSKFRIITIMPIATNRKTTFYLYFDYLNFWRLIPNVLFHFS